MIFLAVTGNSMFVAPGFGPAHMRG